MRNPRNVERDMNGEGGWSRIAQLNAFVLFYPIVFIRS